MFLQVSVDLAPRGLSATHPWQADTPLGRHPLAGRHPPGTQTAPQADNAQGRHPLGHPTWQTPPRDGHCSGQYASYWNAFLLKLIPRLDFSVCPLPFSTPKNIANDLTQTRMHSSRMHTTRGSSRPGGGGDPRDQAPPGTRHPRWDQEPLVNRILDTLVKILPYPKLCLLAAIINYCYPQLNKPTPKYSEIDIP